MAHVYIEDIGKHEPAFRSHDYSFGREQSVRHPITLLLQRDERRRELADQVQRKSRSACLAKDFRQPPP